MIAALDDSIDRDDRTRTEKQFTVKPREPQASLQSLWVYDLDARQERRLTSEANYSVANHFTLSGASSLTGNVSATIYQLAAPASTTTGGQG